MHLNLPVVIPTLIPYCKHLSLRSTLSKYLENLDYLLIDLHQFSREKWISLFEVGSITGPQIKIVFYIRYRLLGLNQA